MILWFTGLSGSGKTTLSTAVAQKLNALNYHTILLDGDVIRSGLCKDLGFSQDDRSENIRRIGEVAKLFMQAKVVAVCAVITPLQKNRDFLRNLIGINYIEIYCKCSLDVCEARDIKGHYKRARAGEIKGFTGIDSVYEEPYQPNVIVDTANQSVDESANIIISYITEFNSFGTSPTQA